MNRGWVEVLFVVLIVFASGVILSLLWGTALPYEERNPGPPAVGRQITGAAWDTGLWSALYMPDSTVACRWDGVNLRCVPVPPGSILLIPTEIK